MERATRSVGIGKRTDGHDTTAQGSPFGPRPSPARNDGHGTPTSGQVSGAQPSSAPRREPIYVPPRRTIFDSRRMAPHHVLPGGTNPSTSLAAPPLAKAPLEPNQQAASLSHPRTSTFTAPTVASLARAQHAGQSRQSSLLPGRQDAGTIPAPVSARKSQSQSGAQGPWQIPLWGSSNIAWKNDRGFYSV